MRSLKESILSSTKVGAESMIEEWVSNLRTVKAFMAEADPKKRIVQNGNTYDVYTESSIIYLDKSTYNVPSIIKHLYIDDKKYEGYSPRVFINSSLNNITLNLSNLDFTYCTHTTDQSVLTIDSSNRNIKIVGVPKYDIEVKFALCPFACVLDGVDFGAKGIVSTQTGSRLADFRNKQNEITQFFNMKNCRMKKLLLSDVVLSTYYDNSISEDWDKVLDYHILGNYYNVNELWQTRLQQLVDHLKKNGNQIEQISFMYESKEYLLINKKDELRLKTI